MRVGKEGGKGDGKVDGKVEEWMGEGGTYLR